MFSLVLKMAKCLINDVINGHQNELFDLLIVFLGAEIKDPLTLDIIIKNHT